MQRRRRVAALYQHRHRSVARRHGRETCVNLMIIHSSLESAPQTRSFKQEGDCRANLAGLVRASVRCQVIASPPGVSC